MTKEIILTRWWKSFSLKKFEAGILWLSVFMLPWQLRHTFYFAGYGGNYFEYPSVHLYATDILIVVLLGLWLVRGARNLVVPKWIWQPLVLWLVWLTAGSWYGIDWQNSLQQSIHYWLIAGWLMYLANNIKDIKQILWPLVWGAGFQAVWGTAQFWLNRDLGMQLLAESPLSPDQGGVMVVGDEAHRQIRAYGMLPHPNILGGLLAFAILPLAKLYGEAKKYQRWILMVLAGVIGLGLVLAFSRMSWLLAAVMIVVAIVLMISNKQWRRSWPVVAVMIVGVVAAGWWQWSNINGRFETDSYLEQKSLNERIVGLKTWGEVMSGNEFAGVGTSNYTQKLIALDPNQLVWTYKPVHNIYALITAENGVVGAAIWLWLIGAGLWLWIKLLKKGWANGWVGMPLVGILAAGMFDHWSVSFQQGRLLLFLALALIILESGVLLKKQVSN